MRKIKKVLKWFVYFLLIPISYLLISFLLTAITINKKSEKSASDKFIFLTTNGVHLDIVIPKEYAETALLNGLNFIDSDKYLSFGWGDENFYINTPNWSDLTFKNAFSAMFLKSSTLMHVTRHKQKRSDWVKIKVTDSQLKKLNSYLQNSFTLNSNGTKTMLVDKGYSEIDDFYKANGSYSCLKTCNSWANSAFKDSGLKACLWTPFDFGLLNKYE